MSLFLCTECKASLEGKFCGTSVNLYLDVAIDTIREKCIMFVPLKQSKKVRFGDFIMKERSL